MNGSDQYRLVPFKVGQKSLVSRSYSKTEPFANRTFSTFQISDVSEYRIPSVFGRGYFHIFSEKKVFTQSGVIHKVRNAIFSCNASMPLVSYPTPSP